MTANLSRNNIIDLLRKGERVFGTFATPGNLDEAQAVRDLKYDFVVFEMEHSGFNFSDLRLSLQFLLGGPRNGEPMTTPLARLPTKGAEVSPWIIKQALDSGLLGIALPHLVNVTDAQRAVAACQYTTPSTPTGNRGWGPFRAARYWGESMGGYSAKADLWPQNPDGELLLMPLIESKDGLTNLDQILTEVKGIGAVMFGGGDLSVELGLPGQMAHPQVEEAMLFMRDICKKHGVATAVLTDADLIERRYDQGFEILISLPAFTDTALDKGRQRAGNSGARGW